MGIMLRVGEALSIPPHPRPHRMIARRPLVLALLAATVLPARAEPASDWAPALHGRARLLDGGRDPRGRLAGVEIALDPGFKTYWREPGESGLPPVLDWSGSDNLARATVAWPVPHRAEDAGGVAYAYEGGTVLPVTVEAADPEKPVSLRLALEYGICKDICIPAKADLRLDLPPQPAGAPTPALAAALARVPRATAVGEAPDGLGVAGVALRPGADGHAVVAVSVRAPQGSAPALFVEAPAGFFLLPPAAPAREGEAMVFAVPVLEAPPKRPARLDLTLTLAAGDGRAVETRASLDTADWPR
jgi:DsbC/DsbD-like thiol-disulfide interchange protein